MTVKQMMTSLGSKWDLAKLLQLGTENGLTIKAHGNKFSVLNQFGIVRKGDIVEVCTYLNHQLQVYQSTNKPDPTRSQTQKPKQIYIDKLKEN